jgi:hypothetical protein
VQLCAAGTNSMPLLAFLIRAVRCLELTALAQTLRLWSSHPSTLDPRYESQLH